MQVWNALHTARWKYRTQKSQKNRHLGTIAQLCRAVSLELRHLSKIEKKLLNSNICSTGTYSMANFGPLAAKIGWRVSGTPANFDGFRVLPSLLQRRRSPEANQTLHDVWPSPTLVHYTFMSSHFAWVVAETKCILATAVCPSPHSHTTPLTRM